MRGDSLCFVRTDGEGCNTSTKIADLLWSSNYSFQAMFSCFLHAFFWVNPRRLKFICRRFGPLCLLHLHTYPPMKMEQTEWSETSVYKIQMPGNYPDESLQHSEHGESLKLRFFNFTFREGLNSSHSLLVVQCTNLLRIVQWSCYVYCMSCLRVAG